MPLLAYDVTGHEQKDLVRISQGLDVYFNVFCRVERVICGAEEQSGPSRRAAYQAFLFGALKDPKTANAHR